MVKKYRQGAVGALLDEYERAVEELKTIISLLDHPGYTSIVDKKTKDMNCVSVQSILNHVVKAGYTYANYIRQQFGDNWMERKENYELYTPEIACRELDNMLQYTSDSLADKTELSFDEMVNNVITTHWGQKYDFEQMLEHAIVHILRHRRQIEIFKLTIQKM
jgi:uncharacterized damage-inducible protein DinB